MTQLGTTQRERNERTWLHGWLRRDGVHFLIASTVASAANLVFHPIVSRTLDIGEYAATATILVLLSVILAPTIALQLAISRAIERQQRLGVAIASTAVGKLFVQSLLGGFAIAAMLFLAADPIAHFLNLRDATPVRYMSAFVIPVCIGLVPKAYLLGERRYRLVAIAVLLGAVVRLVLTMPLSNQDGIVGALAATVIGEVVVAIVLLPTARQLIVHPSSQGSFEVQWQDATGALVATSGFWLLVAVPSVAALHFLDAQTAGRYLAKMVLAQSVIYAASLVSIVAIPRFAMLQTNPSSLRKLLVQLSAAVCALGLVLTLLFGLFDRTLTAFVFGNAFVSTGESPHLLTLSCTGTFLAIVYITMQFHLAKKSRMAAAFPWIGVTLFLAYGSLWHATSDRLAFGSVLASGMVFFLMLQPALFEHAKSSLSELVNEDRWVEDDASLDLTMVVPYFNPGALVRKQVERLCDVLSKSGMTYEIIAVSDGSTDGSEAFLVGLQNDNLRLVRLQQNSGKGEALRVGLAMGRGYYLGFIDADGDIDPVHLDSYLKLVSMYEPDIVLGSKRHPMSEVKYPPLRVLYSWGYHNLVHLLFRLRIRDTQTGLKLIRRDVLVRTLPRMLEKRFAFDLELLVVSRHAGYERFFEAPIRVDHQFSSTVSWRTTVGMLLDTFAIWYRLHLLRYYDEPSRTEQIGVVEHRLSDNAIVGERNILA